MVSPAIRYGIIPAKVIRALAWLRICCYHRRRQKKKKKKNKKNKKYYQKKSQWLFPHAYTIYAFNPNVECIRYTYTYILKHTNGWYSMCFYQLCFRCGLAPLTMSRSSMLLCGRPGVPAVAPFRRLYCVNRMFMVASRTSDRLWRTCRHTEQGGVSRGNLQLC